MPRAGEGVWLAAVLVGVFVAHSGALAAGFVWDDLAIVVQNELTADLSRWPQYFVRDLWAGTPGEVAGGSGYYRPLMILSLAVDRALFGLSAPAAHLHSLLWHLAAVAAGWTVLRALFAGDEGRGEPPAGSVAAATVGALVFGLHPIQSEAVTWVAARNDLMAAALGLVALGRGLVPAPTGRDRAVALGAAVLAGLAKESVVLLPLLLGCLHLARGWSPRRRWRDYLPLVVGILVVVLARTAAGIGSATLPDSTGWALLLRRSPWLVARLGAFVVAPWPLSVVHVLEYLDRMPLWQAILGAVGGLAGAGFVLVRGGARGRAGLLWFVLATAPALVSVADKGWLGERYVYLGMLGLGWAVAGLVPAGRLRWLGLPALAAVLLLQLRARDWQDDIALWSAAWSATPSPFVADGLARVHRIDGDPTTAAAWFTVALDDPEPWAAACGPVVASTLVSGRTALAVQVAGWARQKGCTGETFEGHALMALALAGRWDRVDAALARVPLSMGGRVAEVRAAHHLRTGDPRYAEVLAAFPDDPGLAARADALARSGGTP